MKTCGILEVKRSGDELGEICGCTAVATCADCGARICDERRGVAGAEHASAGAASGSMSLTMASLRGGKTFIEHARAGEQLSYMFDACRTCSVAAFARDLHLGRSGIAARVAAVFLACFHNTGAGNVRAGVLLKCCHNLLPQE